MVLVLAVLLGGIYICKHYYTSPKAPQDSQIYVVKGGKVYYRSGTVTQQGNEGFKAVDDFEMKDADAKTFVTLDYSWAKDKNNLFYLGQLVLPKEGTQPADLSSFTFVDTSGRIGKDNRAVYTVLTYQEKWVYAAIPEADPATFAFVENGPYAKDKKNVYYLDLPFGVKKIEGVDGSTFTVLGECAVVEVSRAYYAWDARSVIAGDKILKGADRATFKIVAGFNSGPDGMYMAGTYSVDKNHVYKNCGETTKGNPTTCAPGDLKACE